MTERNGDEYGFPDGDDLTAGPDVDRARRAYDESQAPTDEIDAIIAESRQQAAEIIEIGRANHFVDKWKSILLGSTA